MGRKRQISPELWTDPKISKVGRDVRLLFIGLISNANDWGKLRGTPSTIRSKIFPDDDIQVEVLDEWLNELAALGLIVRWNVGGEPFVFIKNWNKHQNVAHPQKDEFPDPPREALKADYSRTVHEQLAKSSKAYAYIYIYNKIYKDTIGIDYMINYGRDTKLMRDILNTCGEELTEKLIKEFFKYGEDPLAWYHDKSRSVPTFKAALEGLIQRVRKEV